MTGVEVRDDILERPGSSSPFFFFADSKNSFSDLALALSQNSSTEPSISSSPQNTTS